MNTARQKTLKTQDNLFRLLCDNLTSGIVLLDSQGEVEYLNPSLKKLFDPEIHHWSDLKAFMIAMCEKPFPGDSELGAKISRISGFMKSGEAGGIHEETVAVHGKGGGRSCATVRVTLLENRRCLIIFQDTTGTNPFACVLMEEWRSGDTVRILRKIAHDSDNLLGAVNGYAELALGTLPDREDPLRHFIQQILKGSTRARDLMKHIDILALLENSDEAASPITAAKS
jgi:nitrogen-specific signal transduction histidine kinase